MSKGQNLCRGRGAPNQPSTHRPALLYYNSRISTSQALTSWTGLSLFFCSFDVHQMIIWLPGGNFLLFIFHIILLISYQLNLSSASSAPACLPFYLKIFKYDLLILVDIRSKDPARYFVDKNSNKLLLKQI